MRIRALCVLLLLSVACSSNSSDERPGSETRTLPSRTTGPYVSVAIDNHFHDIHPVDKKEIAADRPFVVRNEGRNLHNVTVVDSKITKDIKPGESFRIDPVSQLGPPGTYKIFCKYHASDGMRGEFIIVEDDA
jgi:Cupredoxin-like domain